MKGLRIMAAVIVAMVLGEIALAQMVAFPTGPRDPGTNVPCGSPCPRPGHPPQKPPTTPKPSPCIPCNNGEGYDCENGCRV